MIYKSAAMAADTVFPWSLILNNPSFPMMKIIDGNNFIILETDWNTCFFFFFTDTGMIFCHAPLLQLPIAKMKQWSFGKSSKCHLGV